ncbi:MAG: hypothetical protein EOM59_00910 [Clostridia bacterium]|nr:hypothetical protein [Clostridia bacterium]
MGKKKFDFLIGQKIPQSLLATEWVQDSKHEGEKNGDYKGYEISQTIMENHIYYAFEFLSGYRGNSSNVSLNINLYTDLNNTITSISTFAWQYACNMFSDKTDLRSSERKQIENAMNRILDLVPPVIEKNYAGIKLPTAFINSEWEERRNRFKTCTFMGKVCTIYSRAGSNGVQEVRIFIPSPARKNIDIVIFFITDLDFIIKSADAVSHSNYNNAIDLGVLDVEKTAVIETLKTLGL